MPAEVLQHPAGGAKNQSQPKEKGHAMADYTIYRDRVADEDPAALFPSVSPRNSKVGNIPSFSTLPGGGLMTLSDGRAVVDVPGTCGSACSACERHCYAARIAKFRRQTAVSWARNTIITRAGDFERLKRAILAHIDLHGRELFRFHVAGELETAAQFRAYCEIAEARPLVRFALYTHRFYDVATWAIERGGTPANLLINASLDNRAPSAEDVALAREVNARFFVCDGGTNAAALAKFPRCAAVDRDGNSTGIHCDECQACYIGAPGSVTVCTEH